MRIRERLTRNAPRTSPIRGLAARAAQAIAAPMKTMSRMIAGLALLAATPVYAIVGGGAPSADGVARSIVTIVGLPRQFLHRRGDRAQNRY